MKRIWAVLMAVALLACLAGCGKEEADKSGAEKAELYTFAGLEWDTPKSKCEAALEKGTGIGFVDVTATDYWVPPCFAAEPGHYSVLGMPLDTGDGNDYIEVYYGWSEAAEERGEASYDNDADWVLSRVECYHPEVLTCNKATGEVPAEELAMLQGVIDNAIRKYGQPDLAYVYSTGSNSSTYYSVPAKEYAYIVHDCFALAREKGWSSFYLELRFHNIYLSLRVLPPKEYNPGMWSNGSCDLTLHYGPDQLSKKMATYDGAEVGVFPWLNGKPDYVVVDP